MNLLRYTPSKKEFSAKGKEIGLREMVESNDNVLILIEATIIKEKVGMKVWLLI